MSYIKKIWASSISVRAFAYCAKDHGFRTPLEPMVWSLLTVHPEANGDLAEMLGGIKAVRKGTCHPNSHLWLRTSVLSKRHSLIYGSYIGLAFTCLFYKTITLFFSYPVSIELSEFSLGTRTPFIKFLRVFDTTDDLRKIMANEVVFRQPPEDIISRPKYQIVIDADIALDAPDSRFILATKLKLWAIVYILLLSPISFSRKRLIW